MMPLETRNVFAAEKKTPVLLFVTYSSALYYTFLEAVCILSCGLQLHATLQTISVWISRQQAQDALTFKKALSVLLVRLPGTER